MDTHRPTKKRLTYMISRSMRLCLVLSRATSSDVGIAEAREPSISVLRDQETCRHYLRLASHTHVRPLFQELLRRTECHFRRLLVILSIVAPHHALWPPCLTNPPGTISPPNVQTEIPGFESKSRVTPMVAKMMSLSPI